MKVSSQILSGAILLCGLAVVVGQLNATATALGRDDRHGGNSEGGVASGADVIVGAIPNAAKHGTVGGISAYSFGTTSCNIGTEELWWYDFDPDGAGPIQASDHPAIPQNAYRIKGGRIEQIGMSWCKHGFCALQQTLCATCTPAGEGCSNLLGIGCSDPYSATLNGFQSSLGPRSQINAATGVFPQPWTAPVAAPTIGRRCQIPIADLDPALNAGAIYLCEGQYVHRQDAAAGNDTNNASYREFSVGALSNGSYTLNLVGATIQQLPAIYGWKTVDPLVEVLALDDADGRFYVAYRATDNGNGTWHYEYAVMNMNSDASGASFQMALPVGIVVTNQGFKDIEYHSGEPYNGIDWAMSAAGGMLSWQCTETFASNVNANALRFATLYNFWFDANAAPMSGSGSIGLFKTSGSVEFTALVVGDVPIPPACIGDLSLDGVVDGADIGMLLGEWGPADRPTYADMNGDGAVDGADLGMLLGAWGACGR